MKYFSMYSGIGGFELGMPKNFECIGYSEIEPNAIKIYEKHFKHKNYGNADEINEKELPDFDLLVGGFPCQSFSIAGKREGFNDRRGTQFFNIERILKEKRPKYFLLENVKGLLSHNKGRTFKIILSAFEKLDYDTESLVIDSADYQRAPRQRIYMFGMHRFKSLDVGKRNIKALSLLFSYVQRGGNQVEKKFQENSRESARIIRTFARLPDWLDGWDTVYSEKSEVGKCSND